MAKRRIAQRHHQTPHAADTHERFHVVGIVFREALTILHRHLDVVLDLLVRVVDLAVHLEAVANLVARRPENHVRALIHERQQALDQVIHEAVLVQVVRLHRVRIQNFRRVNAAIVRGSQKLRVLAQVPHGIGRDLLPLTLLASKVERKRLRIRIRQVTRAFLVAPFKPHIYVNLHRRAMVGIRRGSRQRTQHGR